MWTSYTAARIRFALQNVKELTTPQYFWKMRSAKCAPNCSESSICISMNLFCTPKSQKLWGSEHFWKMRSAKCAPDCSERSIRISKSSNKNEGSEHFLRMRLANSLIHSFLDSMIHSIDSLIHSFIDSLTCSIVEPLIR